MLLGKAESWVSSIHSAKLLRKLLNASWLLLWTWLHTVRARLLVPLVNGMRSDPFLGLTECLLQCKGPWELGQHATTNFLRSSIVSALPYPACSLPTHTSLTGPLQPASVHHKQGCSCHALFSLLQQQALPLLLPELCLIILSGLLCIMINS